MYRVLADLSQLITCWILENQPTKRNKVSTHTKHWAGSKVIEHVKILANGIRDYKSGNCFLIMKKYMLKISENGRLLDN